MERFSSLSCKASSLRHSYSGIIIKRNYDISRPGSDMPRRSRKQSLGVSASLQVRESFNRAADVFENGNRMETLKIYEQALKSKELSQEERLEALYGITAVHASFGDVEQAQMSLREGLACGLDFEAALKDDRLLKWRSGPQVLVQLKKFAKAVTSIKNAVSRPSEKASSPPSSAQKGRGVNLADSLKTDISGIDTTIGGIIRRVALLLLVAIGAGTALFFIGLELSGISR